MLLKAMTIIIVLFGNIFKRITQYSLVAVVVQKKVAQISSMISLIKVIYLCDIWYVFTCTCMLRAHSKSLGRVGVGREFWQVWKWQLQYETIHLLLLASSG